MASELEKRNQKTGAHIHLEPIHHTTDKLARIEILQPLAKNGTIRFSKRHRTLLEQMKYFPKGNHDDGPDALEMAVQVARIGTNQVGVWHSGMSKRSANKDWLSDYRRNLGWNLNPGM